MITGLGSAHCRTFKSCTSHVCHCATRFFSGLKQHQRNVPCTSTTKAGRGDFARGDPNSLHEQQLAIRCPQTLVQGTGKPPDVRRHVHASADGVTSLHSQAASVPSRPRLGHPLGALSLWGARWRRPRIGRGRWGTLASASEQRRRMSHFPRLFLCLSPILPLPHCPPPPVSLSLSLEPRLLLSDCKQTACIACVRVHAYTRTRIPPTLINSCVHACVRACVRACARARVRGRAGARTRGCVWRGCAGARVRGCMGAWVRGCARVRGCEGVCLHVCMHMCACQCMRAVRGCEGTCV